MALQRESSLPCADFKARKHFENTHVFAQATVQSASPVLTQVIVNDWQPADESVELPDTLFETSLDTVDSPCRSSRRLLNATILTDPLLENVPRVDWQGRTVPELGGIKILVKLGQGGMGAVYCGFHPRLNQQVAVKILPIELAQRSPDLIKRFVREAQLAAGVRSPHLVGVLDVNEVNGLFYLVMEFVDGPSAEAHLRDTLLRGQSGLPERVALDICIAAARGLDAAHANGVIHRDIKPGNILIPRVKSEGIDGAVTSRLAFQSTKLTDLGLARSEMGARKVTRANICMGTPGFLSPEQAYDAGRAGKPADVFSLGATLYCLLTGDAPFGGEDTNQVLRATVRTPHDPIYFRRLDVSAQTASLVDACLAKNPSDRPASATTLLRELCACRRGV